MSDVKKPEEISKLYIFQCIVYTFFISGMFSIPVYIAVIYGYWIGFEIDAFGKLLILIAIILHVIFFTSWLGQTIHPSEVLNPGGIGGCFIATATYGTPLAVEIDILRDFRDIKLNTNPIGRTFIKFYYLTSPPIANFIKKYEILKWITRQLLKPIIFLITNKYGKISRKEVIR